MRYPGAALSRRRFGPPPEAKELVSDGATARPNSTPYCRSHVANSRNCSRQRRHRTTAATRRQRPRGRRRPATLVKGERVHEKTRRTRPRQSSPAAAGIVISTWPAAASRATQPARSSYRPREREGKNVRDLGSGCEDANTVPRHGSGDEPVLPAHHQPLRADSNGVGRRLAGQQHDFDVAGASRRHMKMSFFRQWRGSSCRISPSCVLPSPHLPSPSSAAPPSTKGG